MRRRRSDVEVDLTPLIDVLFMLILFFVLTAAFVQGRLDVDLPSGRGETLPADPVVITVRSDGSLLWAGEVTTQEELIERACIEKRKGTPLLLAGDRAAPYGFIASLLDALRLEGVDEISLALGGEDSHP